MLLEVLLCLSSASREEETEDEVSDEAKEESKEVDIFLLSLLLNI
jgi:hypothetical protein